MLPDSPILEAIDAVHCTIASVQNMFDKEAILHSLMSTISTETLRARASVVSKARHIPEEAVAPYLRDTFKLSLPPETSGTETIAQKMSAMISQVCPLLQTMSLHLCRVLRCGSMPCLGSAWQGRSRGRRALKVLASQQCSYGTGACVAGHWLLCGL